MGVYIRDDNYSDYSAMQGPAPSGFHVPLSSEWGTLCGILTTTFGLAKNATTIGTYLKMPMAGYRNTYANVSGVGTSGRYWSSFSNAVNNAHLLYFYSSNIITNYGQSRANGNSVRCFKDAPIIPTSSWTTLYDGSSVASGAGVFYNTSLGLISVSGDGNTWYTIMDKNLGATTVFNQGDTVNDANSGYFYQWGNNYGFPHSGSVTTSSTKVDASNYGPGNYYNSSTFITGSGDWSSVQNDNLWGGTTGVNHMSELKNAYIGEYPERWKPGANTLAYLPLNGNANDYSGNGNNGTVYNANWITENNRQYIQGTNSNNNIGAYVVLPVIPITSECTFSAWVKFNTSNNYYCNIVGCYYQADDSKCFSSLTLNSSKWWINGSNGSGLYDIVGQTNISSGWHLVAVTIKSGEQKGYLDGVVKGSTGNAANFAATNTVPFTINRLYNSNATGGCAVGDFILEDKVWTAQEIADYYNLTKSQYGIS